MRVVLVGNGRLAACLFHALRASRHEIVGLIQNGRMTRPPWRAAALATARVLGRADNLLKHGPRAGIPVIWIDRMTPEELAPLRALQPDLILVGGFGIILKKPIIELPRIGVLNVHSSLLPRHRGPNPFCWAIVHGDAETGVTFHAVDEGIDTGPIMAQCRMPIEASDTMYSIYAKASALAGTRVAEVLDYVEANGLAGQPQDPALATYEKRATIADSWIDWARPAEELDRLVRGMSPSPMPRFLHRGAVVRVAKTLWSPEPAGAAPGTVLKSGQIVTVATGCGKLTIRVAFTSRPVPWIWPAPWRRVHVGERLT